MAQSNAFRKLLEATRVSDVLQNGRDILIVSADEDPTAAFKRIVARGVLSAPVFDPETKGYVGFLDVKDLVSFVVFREEEKVRTESRKGASSNSLLDLPDADIRQYFDVAARMYAQPVQGVNIKYLARRHPFRPLHASDTLADVARVLSTNGVHRVPIVDRETGKVIDIVSQSTIIQFVDVHKEEISSLTKVSVEASGIGSRPVLPVLASDTALHTFQTMSQHNRSGVAVVDENGRFVSNTSSSDLKLLLADLDKTNALLGGSIIDFLSAVRQSDVGDTRYPAIAVSRKVSLEQMISKLAATRIHRLFVADDDHGYKPEAVVSITDVLAYLENVGIDGPVISVTSNF